MAFWEKDKKSKKENKTDAAPTEFGNVAGGQNSQQSTSQITPKDYGILRNFYISEKSTALNSLNQYVFKVFDKVNKNEIKKQVEKTYNVKVKNVKTINLQKKKRTLGRHSGFKQGIKKAIVVLKKGYSIEHNKA